MAKTNQDRMLGSRHVLNTCFRTMEKDLKENAANVTKTTNTLQVGEGAFQMAFLLQSWLKQDRKMTPCPQISSFISLQSWKKLECIIKVAAALLEVGSSRIVGFDTSLILRSSYCPYAKFVG